MAEVIIFIFLRKIILGIRTSDNPLEISRKNQYFTFYLFNYVVLYRSKARKTYNT